MKRILKQGVYRIKCPYCDCEFEYEREDVVSKSLKNPPSLFGTYGPLFTVRSMVRCPSCNNLIYHQDSVRSKIETVSL